MSDFIEAFVLMLPSEAGGRLTPIAPRDGSYQPFIRVRDEKTMLRVRFIEGPPAIAPGDSARVVVELENERDRVRLSMGTELDLLEPDASTVGYLTVGRYLASSP